jgi:hypothetical protein
LTPFAANPLYDSNGEIPEAPRGSGFETTNGQRTRSDAEVGINVRVDYSFYFGEQRLVISGDIFNAFNNQYVAQYTQDTETQFQVNQPDFGRPWQYNDPLQFRIGARFEF